METIPKVNVAGIDYTVENWSGDHVLISRRGTAYMVQPGVSQPMSFPGGTPLRKKGNSVYVLNVGGVIEETTKR